MFLRFVNKIKFKKTNFTQFRLIVRIFVLSSLFISTAKAQSTTISSSYGWTAKIEIQALNVVPSTTNCQWSYHYGIYYALRVTFTGSTSNRSLHFNTYFDCTGGSGNEPYTPDEVYTTNVTKRRTTNLTHRGYSAVSSYNYGSNPSCTTIKLSDANCNNFRIVYWGSGIVDGQVTVPIIPYNPSPLPIELLSFSGEEANNEIELNWSTAAERENDYFTIERSQDAENFEVIGTVEGSGTSSVTMNYSFQDKQAPAGVNYYRLTQTDYNGTSETFDIIAVMKNGATEISSTVFPNPTHDGKITLKVNAEKTSDLVYSVYSIEGKHIATEAIYNEVTEIILPTHQSNYFITVQKGNEVIGRHKVSVY